jgi:serine/threonine-protein kinase
MSSSHCAKCGVLSATLLPSGLCTTCHGRGDPTSVAELEPISSAPPTATFGPLSETDTRSFTDDPDADPARPGRGYAFGVELGKGGMGQVFQAVQVSTGQTVAIKRLNPEGITASMFNRFVTEAQSLAALNHPNVVRVYDFNPSPRDPQLVMELVDGAPLSHRIKERPLDPDTAARLIADAARGVHAAHQRGIIHRDLKPQNLLLTADGVIKVADFGLAKRLDENDENTVSGHLVGGTPGYMAPEQVDHDAPPCDGRTDVWGLGATLYAALVGKPPYPTGTKNSVRVLTDPFPPPRSVNKAVPPVLDAIVCKCLEKEPAKRYPSAADLADDLDRFRRGESTVAKPLTWRERTWRRVRTVHRGLLVAWAVAAVTGVIAILATPRPSGQQTTFPPPVADEPKVDELAVMQAALLDKKSVTLVPHDGPPRWHRWLAGAAVLSPNELRDGGLQFQTGEISYLALMTDPRVESYRIEAELRHFAVQPGMSRCGLFLGYDELRGSIGDATRCVLTWEFSEFWDAAETKPEFQKSHGCSLVSRFDYQPVAGVPPSPNTSGLANFKFQPLNQEGGRWRKVAIDVTPTAVSGFWWDDLKRDWVPAFQVTPDRIDDNRAGRAEQIAAPGAAPVAVPKWHPRRPLGVYAQSCTVCFRSVVLQPTK